MTATVQFLDTSIVCNRSGSDFCLFSSSQFCLQEYKINQVPAPTQAVSYSKYICQKNLQVGLHRVWLARGFCFLGQGGCWWNSQHGKLFDFIGSSVWQETVSSVPCQEQGKGGSCLQVESTSAVKKNNKSRDKTTPLPMSILLCLRWVGTWVLLGLWDTRKSPLSIPHPPFLCIKAFKNTTFLLFHSLQKQRPFIPCRIHTYNSFCKLHNLFHLTKLKFKISAWLPWRGDAPC